jgi:GNAT superfamily N-acetyltransferase
MSLVVTVRQVCPHELTLAADYWNEIVKDAFDEDWDETYPNWRSIFLAAMQRRMASGLQRYYVAEIDGQIAGVAGAQVGEAFFGAVRGYVEGVYVLPAFRRRGVATRLMRECIDWLKTMGCDFVRLQATSEGVPLYESLGFEPTGEMELTLNKTKRSFTETYGAIP